MNAQAAGWRLAASTLGVLDEDLQSVLASFQRYGSDAAELRSAEGALAHTGLGPQQRAELRERFTAAGVEIVATASRIKIAGEGNDDDVVSALSGELRLAADLGAAFVRVFPGAPAARVSSSQVPFTGTFAALAGEGGAGDHDGSVPVIGSAARRQWSWTA